MFACPVETYRNILFIYFSKVISLEYTNKALYYLKINILHFHIVPAEGDVCMEGV